MDRRQIWNFPTADTTSSATKAHCTPFTLPSNGVIELAASSAITLTSNAVFKPECTGTSDSILILTNANSHTSTLTDFRDPFYASTLPECYALAATTVIAYMLVIMLLITPRTFLIEGAVVLGRRGFTNGPSGSDAGIGIGGRPWLQKVAAATVAISLTIATADTLRVAEQQYNQGFQDATALQNAVEDGTELKVIRVISDTFLWLAQVQTLIRLFPRQREKIIIKWTAFALITLDVLFGILNNFVYEGSNRPQSFVDAVPALAYLFQLALSLLYCAWVMYYAITKKRYAFYHPQMRNICLVALLSLVSVLVPVVFFVLDISKPTLAGWGDYVRWVGAAAASVVVWEWVERIEALERNDRKDGVLGREVFDGDEMLEVTPSSERNWSHQFQNRKSGDGGGVTTGSNGRWPAMAGLASRYRAKFTGDVEAGGVRGVATRDHASEQQTSGSRPPLWPSRPAAVATPISRTDTASAESTVYAIRYHPISEATPSIRQGMRRPPAVTSDNTEITESRDTDVDSIGGQSTVAIEHPTDTTKPKQTKDTVDEDTIKAEQKPHAWHALAKVNPFKRRVQGPPPEVSAHTVKPQIPANGQLVSNSNRWDVRTRLEEFAAAQADKMKEKNRQAVNTEPLPVTVIPAPPRRRNAEAYLEELESEERERLAPVRSATTTEIPLTGTTFASSQSPGESPMRTRTPYTPDIINRQSVSHRGSISFVTPERRNGEQPTLNVPRSSPASPQPAPLLPTISIPAPPRRPRNDEE